MMTEDTEGMYPSPEMPEGAPDGDHAETPAEEAQEDQTDSGGESTLVPKAMLQDCKPGDTVNFKVVHVYEDEVEIEPVKGGSSDGDEGSVDAKLDAMAR